MATAGSGGKKSLFKACYAISIHRLASRRGLPIPGLLILDTPTKNIGENINKDEVESFYNALYHYSMTDLAQTQIIIIEKEYHPPSVGPIAITTLEFNESNKLIPDYHRA